MVQADPRNYKRPESVLVVVYTRAGNALMLRRADFSEFWQSVTGSMEWTDETPRATALRELCEETGLKVAPEELRDWQTSNRYVLFPHWRHKYAPGTVENTEHVFSLELGIEAQIVLILPSTRNICGCRSPMPHGWPFPGPIGMFCLPCSGCRMRPAPVNALARGHDGCVARPGADCAPSPD